MDALREISSSWRWRELWLTLGWRDVLLRYRRSRLGPFWISVNMGFVAGAMGYLYSAIMNRPAHEYIPYLTAGFMAWNFLLSLVNDGKDVFVANASAIREVPVPAAVHVYRTLWRNLLIFGHNALVYVALLLIFRIWPFPELFLLVPALALIMLNGMWVALLVGLINVRYRDLGQLIPNGMRLVFFVTPILWYSDAAYSGGAIDGRAAFVYLNPFYYFVEVLRAPLLGYAPGVLVWSVVLGITILGWAVTLPVYAHWRRRIAFWV